MPKQQRKLDESQQQEPGRDSQMTATRFGGKLLVLTVFSLVVALADSAYAHRNPSNCNGNGITLNLVRNVASAVNGQTVTYSISIANNDDPSTGLIACDATNVLVDFYCPGPDGSPNSASPLLVANIADLTPQPAGTPFTSLGSKSCTINVNPGVTDAAASVIAGQQSGNASHACTVSNPCTQGTLHDSSIADHAFSIGKTLGVSINTCVVQVDKQISCDGGATFHDVGLETMDEDGHTDLCLGWNAHNGVPAESVRVRYVVANGGTADLLNCTLTDTNTGFPGAAVGNVLALCAADSDCGTGGTCCTSGEPGGQPPCTLDPTMGGHCVFRSSLSSAACSDTLSAAEPDKATVTCDCTSTPGEVQATAFDEANFTCETPGLQLTKNCAVQDANGNSAITITVKNTGTADLAQCVVSDTNFTDAGCPANGSPSGTSHGVPSCSTTIASLAAGATAPNVTCADTGLTTNSCNVASVTCSIVGSVGPKTITATGPDTCEVCEAQVDKQVSCGDAACTTDADCRPPTGETTDPNAACLAVTGVTGKRCFIDVGFVTNNEDGTATCIGWNTHDAIPAEPLRVELIATNTG